MKVNRLQPQTPQQQLISQTLIDYNAASTYYRQRRDMFLSLLKNKIQMTENEFVNGIQNSISKLWNQQIASVVNSIYWGNRKSGMSGIDRGKIIQERFENSSYLPYLIKAVSSDNVSVFLTQMGNAFEKFLDEKIFPTILQAGNNFINQQSEQLISEFTGGKISKSNTVQGIKSIRPDEIIRLSSISFEEKNGVYTSSTGLPVELQGQLTINYEDIAPSLSQNAMNENILRQFLTEKGNFFGFSAKTWGEQINGKPFRQSSVMQKLLNQVFNQTDSSGKRHSWEYDYTQAYIAFFLAHNDNLYNIIGPTNIALVTKQGILWMDSFLKNHMFYMRVQMEKKYGRQFLKNNNRAFPQIQDTNIYIRRFGGDGNIVGIGSKMHNTKQSGVYYDLTLKI